MRTHPLLAFATATTTIATSVLNPVSGATHAHLHRLSKSLVAHMRADQRLVRHRSGRARALLFRQPIQLLSQRFSETPYDAIPMVQDRVPFAHAQSSHPFVGKSTPTLSHRLVGAKVPARTAAQAHGLGQSVWVRLRECESGGNYSENTGNGYYGAYQFSAWTWWSLGLPGMANLASSATQDAAARSLQVRSGWSSWPRCSQALGLS